MDLLLNDDYPYKTKSQKIKQRFHQSILNLAIKKTFWKLREMQRKWNDEDTRVRQLLPDIYYENFMSGVRKNFQKYFNKVKMSNIVKLENLTKNSQAVLMNNKDNNKKIIFNNTDVVLPCSVNNILSLGSNFCLPLRKKDISVPRLIKNVENCILLASANENRRNELRASSTNIITNFLNNNSSGEGKNRLIQ